MLSILGGVSRFIGRGLRARGRKGICWRGKGGVSWLLHWRSQVLRERSVTLFPLGLRKMHRGFNEDRGISVLYTKRSGKSRGATCLAIVKLIGILVWITSSSWTDIMWIVGLESIKVPHPTNTGFMHCGINLRRDGRRSSKSNSGVLPRYKKQMLPPHPTAYRWSAASKSNLSRYAPPSLMPVSNRPRVVCFVTASWPYMQTIRHRLHVVG
jgi:hypothetical protein